MEYFGVWLAMKVTQVLGFSMFRPTEGRYTNRPYPYEGFSDEENNARGDRSTSSGGRYPAAGQKGYSRSGDVTSTSGGQKRPAGKYNESYNNSRGGSPENSSDSESDSSEGHSATQSGSSSSGSSSEDESEAESRSGSPGSQASKSNKSSSLCVKNLSTRSSDGSIREGLYHEFKKHGEVTRIYVQGTGASRSAIIYFRRPDESERAMEVCQGKMFLGAEMHIQAWNGPPEKGDRYDSNDYPPRYRSNATPQLPDGDFDPCCTRTLFVGNIEKTTTYGDLKEAFERFGEVIDVDIKKQPGNNPYSFIQFADLSSAIQARQRMDREFIGRNRVKVGFGKVAPINTIWIGGVTVSLSEQQLDRHFSRYGRVTRVVINRSTSQALVSFDGVESAGIAQAQMKGRSLFGRRVRVEMVSRDSRQLFYDSLQKVGQTDSTNSSSGRRYDNSPPDRMRPRGGGPGHYEYRRGSNRGGMTRPGMRREARQ